MAATKSPQNAGNNTSNGTVDMKLEAVALPVSDLDRAKSFYLGLGWRLDADFSKDGARVLQMTPPGSDCSIQFGTNVTPESPRSSLLVVSDIAAARAALVGRGVEVSEVFHYASPPGPFGDKVGGPDPDGLSYGSYASFSDPDGNAWLLQQVTTRLHGRIDRSTTSFSSASDLASALRRAEAAHGEHEKRNGGQRDENWPDWYAKYLAAEQHGEELPT